MTLRPGPYEHDPVATETVHYFPFQPWWNDANKRKTWVLPWTRRASVCRPSQRPSETSHGASDWSGSESGYWTGCGLWVLWDKHKDKLEMRMFFYCSVSWITIYQAIIAMFEGKVHFLGQKYWETDKNVKRCFILDRGNTLLLSHLFN